MKQQDWQRDNRDKHPVPSSGMVSAQYLAHYKAEQSNRADNQLGWQTCFAPYSERSELR